MTFYRSEEETYQITFRLSIRTLCILNKCHFAFMLVFIDQIFLGQTRKLSEKYRQEMSSTYHFFFIVADISVKENHDSGL